MAGIFVFVFSLESFSKSDSITILIRGEYKKRDHFLVRFNNSFKSFGYENSNFEMKVYIDSLQEPFSGLPIRLYKKTIFGAQNIHQLFLYDPERNFIHIYYYKKRRKKFFDVFYLNTKESIYPFGCVID